MLQHERGMVCLVHQAGLHGKMGVAILTDCCTTVSEILPRVALHAVSTRAKPVLSAEVL